MNKKGFTLVEVMAVVALIAILSVATIVGVTSIINRQRIKTATLSEQNIGEAALTIQSEKQKLYLPACIDKTSGNYINISQTIIKKINDDLRLQMKNQNINTDQEKKQFIRDYVKSINNDPDAKLYFSNTYIGAKDINCFKLTSVADIVKEGYLKDLDDGCDRASLIIVYNKKDSTNTAGNLKSVQETGICKGSASEEKGPLITVNPEQDYSSSATKIIKITATANESNLKTDLTLHYGWSKSLRNKPDTWLSESMTGDKNKMSVTVSKTGMDEEYYLWIKAGSIKDNQGYSNTTIATGPYSFLPTPTITYMSKYYDSTFNDPIRGQNRCNGEVTCNGKTKVVVYSKPYGKDVSNNIANLCVPKCPGYEFETWKYTDLDINNNSIVGDRNNHSLAATYSPKSFVVTYDTRGGISCSPSTKTVTFDEPYETLCHTSRVGYSPVGEWFTEPNGGKEINSSTPVTIPNDHKLYKHWDPHKFMVAYNGAGGTGSISSHQCTYDEACNLKNNNFNRTGYTFNGYKLNNTGTAYKQGASIKNASATDGETLTYFAQWCRNCINPAKGTCMLDVNTPGICKYTTTCNTGYRITSGNATYNPSCAPNTYTIAFNGNGNTGGSTASKSCTYDQNCVLTNNGFSKTGYTFIGWATSAGGAVAYANRATVKNLTSTNGRTVTLYAKWKPITYKIVFNGNGGSGSTASKSCTYDQNCKLTNNGFSKKAYIFSGWATSAAGAVVYGNGATVKNLTTTNAATVTLYAKWKPITYKIVFNGNGSTGGSTANKTCTYDQNCVLTSNGFSKTGHTYTGWATSAGGAVAYANGATVKNLTTTNGATINLYAKWKINTYTISIGRDGSHISSVSLDGSTTVLSKTVNYGTVVTISATAKTYHHFDEWSDGNKTKTNRKITVTKNITLTAQGKENTATIYYFKNGGKLQKDNGKHLDTNTPDPITHVSKVASYSGYRTLYDYTAAKSNIHMKKKGCTSKKKFVIKKHGTSTKLTTVNEADGWNGRIEQWKAFGLLDELKVQDSAVDVYPQWKC